MKKLNQIIFRVTNETYGTPDPFIEDGTILIFIQDGEAQFAKYQKATLDNPFPVLSYPKNGKILKYLALDILKNDNPKHLNSEIALHFVCPEEYIERLKW